MTAEIIQARNPALMRGREVQIELAVSKSTLFRLLREGHLQRVLLPGGGLRITRESVERCIREWEKE